MPRHRAPATSDDAAALIATIAQKFDKMTVGDRASIATLLKLRSQKRGVDGARILAHLLNRMNIKTVRGIIARGRRRRVGQWRLSTALASGSSAMASGSSAMASGSSALASGSAEVLPAICTPATATLHESESDLDLDLDAVVANDKPTRLQEWQCHPNYKTGMRVAQLSTFWIDCRAISSRCFCHGYTRRVLELLEMRTILSIF